MCKKQKKKQQQQMEHYELSKNTLCYFINQITKNTSDKVANSFVLANMYRK